MESTGSCSSHAGSDHRHTELDLTSVRRVRWTYVGWSRWSAGGLRSTVSSWAHSSQHLWVLHKHTQAKPAWLWQNPQTDFANDAFYIYTSLQLQVSFNSSLHHFLKSIFICLLTTCLSLCGCDVNFPDGINKVLSSRSASKLFSLKTGNSFSVSVM